MSQQDNPTTWWHSDKPARHILRYEDGSEVELSESDLDAMMRRWDQVVREMESARAEQLVREEPSVLSVSAIEKHRNRRQANAIRRLTERVQHLSQGQILPQSGSPAEPESVERDPVASQGSSALERGAKQ
ncbi:MAG: hypothetical protein M1154_12865 [Gammaproteobacteria bacterium]|nr:hypothetical protein [Gammaproteobacteria bacterium]